MNRVWRQLARFGLVVVGYGVAAVAAGLFLHLPALDNEEAAHSGFLTVPILALLIARVAFFPAAAAILVAEILGLRSCLFHALAGAAVAVAARLLWLRLEAPDALEGSIAATAGAGLVGGMAYWLIAGRSSGAAFAFTAPGPSGS